MTDATKETARDLCAYVDAAPSPFHAVQESARRLERAGFRRLEEVDAWRLEPGRYLVVRGGSLVAWVLPEGIPATRGFRILGAHTDSPNLRVKPRPDSTNTGFRRLGVEIYGSPLFTSWLDRPLGLSGRVFLRGEAGPEERLFLVDRPVLCVPQLAIHLNRGVNDDGLKLNPQEHLVPVWELEDETERGFRDFLAEELAVEPDAILSWDAMCHERSPSTLVGAREELLSAPRLDNLCSCFVGIAGLLRRLERGDSLRVPVLCLFDHEEVGSTSSRGARGPLLRHLLERTVLGRGGGREDFYRALADSACVSADMAHATHPNYADLHDPDHHLRMNAGPVIKINSNQRYASEGSTEALFQDACERADVPYQKWVNRTDLACGSTIGPITAANLGIGTVDVGNPQLAMHSARELCGARDPAFLARALETFWE